MYACILNNIAISFSTKNIYGDYAIDLGDNFMIPGDKEAVIEDGTIKWVPILNEPEAENEFVRMMKKVVNNI